jgi:hypothetical protein
VKGARKLGDSLVGKAEDSFQSLKDKFNSKVDEVAKRSKEGINSVSERVKV